MTATTSYDTQTADAADSRQVRFRSQPNNDGVSHALTANAVLADLATLEALPSYRMPAPSFPEDHVPERVFANLLAARLFETLPSVTLDDAYAAADMLVCEWDELRNRAVGAAS